MRSNESIGGVNECFESISPVHPRKKVFPCLGLISFGFSRVWERENKIQKKIRSDFDVCSDPMRMTQTKRRVSLLASSCRLVCVCVMSTLMCVCRVVSCWQPFFFLKIYSVGSVPYRYSTAPVCTAKETLRTQTNVFENSHVSKN